MAKKKPKPRKPKTAKSKRRKQKARSVPAKKINLKPKKTGLAKSTGKKGPATASPSKETSGSVGMTEADFATIETQLALQLPESYRRILLEQLQEPMLAEWLRNGGSLYVNSQQLLTSNRDERPATSGTSCAFPDWAETFFMIGDNGGGDYFCLRRDGEPGVWMIGSDCGDEPTCVAETFQQYVEEVLQSWGEELQRREEMEQRRLIHAAENEAQLASIQRDNAPATARDWVTKLNTNPMFFMLDQLWHHPSPRKLRLFGLASCAQIPGLTEAPEFREAIDMAWKMTSNEADPGDVARIRTSLIEKVQQLKSRYREIDPAEYGRRLWTTQAVLGLFSPDNDNPDQRTGCSGGLKDVYNAASCAKSKFTVRLTATGPRLN